MKQRGGRDECEAVRGKTLKEQQRRSDRGVGGRRRSQQKQRAEWKEEKRRGERDKVIFGCTIFDVLLVPKSSDAVTR